MGVSALAPVLQGGLQLWLLGLAVVVAMKLFLQGDRLSGLLAAGPRAPADQSLLADRLQLLVMSLFAAGWYLLDVSRAVAASPHPLTAMPPVDSTLLAILTGSQSVYLAGKVGRAPPA